MNKLMSLIMYLLWTLTIVAILGTTFTNFQYEDLNIIAVVLFVFAGVNSYFTMTMGRKVK